MQACTATRSRVVREALDDEGLQPLEALVLRKGYQLAIGEVLVADGTGGVARRIG